MSIVEEREICEEFQTQLKNNPVTERKDENELRETGVFNGTIKETPIFKIKENNYAVIKIEVVGLNETQIFNDWIPLKPTTYWRLQKIFSKSGFKLTVENLNSLNDHLNNLIGKKVKFELTEYKNASMDKATYNANYLEISENTPSTNSEDFIKEISSAEKQDSTILGKSDEPEIQF